MDGEYTYKPIYHTFLERRLFTMSKYIELKRKGKFYEVKHEDAYILWYLLRYKIHNNKVGFPESSLFKVLEVLKENKVGYRLSLDDDLSYSKSTTENKYEEILEKAKKEWLKEKKEKDLLEKIKKANQEDLEKIIDYMEEVL